NCSCHQASQGAPNESLNTKFCQRLPLPGGYGADTSDLDTYRSKIGIATECISGYYDGLLAEKSGCFELCQADVCDKFVEYGFLAEQPAHGQHLVPVHTD